MTLWCQCTMGNCTSGERLQKWTFQQIFYYLENLVLSIFPWKHNILKSLESASNNLYLSFIFQIGRSQCWPPKFLLCSVVFPACVMTNYRSQVSRPQYYLDCRHRHCPHWLQSWTTMLVRWKHLATQHLFTFPLCIAVSLPTHCSDGQQC